MKETIITVILINFILHSIAQNISFTHDANGNRKTRVYSPVRLASPDPARDSSIFFQSNPGITVFPNPASVEVSVRIDSMDEGENAIVQLIDELGKIVSERVQVEKKLIFDLAEYHSGLYYMKIYFREKAVSYKFIKL